MGAKGLDLMFSVILLAAITIFTMTKAAVEAIKEIVLIFLLFEGVLLFITLLDSNDIFHGRVIIIEIVTVALQVPNLVDFLGLLTA